MSDQKEHIQKLEGPIFIFGGSGFIGSNLLQKILSIRSDCYAITHNTRTAWRLKLMKIPAENILYCDINHKKSVDSLFQKHGVKTIFNLSAYGGSPKQEDTSLIYETNIGGTINILEACKNVHAYIHAGSSSEYGTNCSNPDEKDELIPNSHYSLSKISTSYILKYYAKFQGLPCLNLRLYSIYGPWEEPDRLIPRIVEFGLKQDLPPLVNPAISRDFVFIDDCVEAFILAATKVNERNRGESINIGSGQKTTLADLVQLSSKIFSIEVTPSWQSMPDRKWDTLEWYGNFTKAEKLLSWTPSISLEEGLKRTAMWQQEQNYSTTVLSVFQQPQKASTISVVIACYKDGEAIPYMYARLVETFRKLDCNYELIFVNDNSPDNSQQILEQICQDDLKVICIQHSRNFGSQAAFMSGMGISTGDAVVLMDGDLQDPPEMIESFVEKWLEGFQVVYGNRTKRETSRWMNFAYSSFYKLFSKMSNIKIPKNAGDFSLIDKKVVEHLVALPEKEQFLRGLRAWVGFRQTGVDYFRPERMFGKSTNNLHKNIGWAKKGILSFSYLPLEIMSYIGFFLTFVSFLAIIFQIVYKFLYPDLPHGIPTIIVLVLFFGGIQLLAISLIGEYIAKIVDETKARPKFIRDKVIIKGRTIESNSELKNLLK